MASGGGDGVGELRSVAEPFVASGPSGVALRTRLKHLTPGDEKVLRLIGAHLGSLASKDLKTRCRDGLEHSGQTRAVRKRELTPLSSSRWAGAITKATHDQWAPARRCQLAHIQNLEAGVRTVENRLSRPVGQRGTRKTPALPLSSRNGSSPWRPRSASGRCSRVRVARGTRGPREQRVAQPGRRPEHPLMDERGEGPATDLLDHQAEQDEVGVGLLELLTRRKCVRVPEGVREQLPRGERTARPLNRARAKSGSAL